MLQGVLDNLHEHSWGYFLTHETTVNWLQVILLWILLAVIANAVIRGLLAGFAKAAKALQRRDNPAAGDADALAWLMAPLLFLVALWLRLLIPPFAFMHENAHGYMLFNDIGFLEPYRDVYGLAYFAIHAPLRLIFGAKFASLLGWQAVLSALIPAFGFLVAWRGLRWNFAQAAFGGIVVALHPVLLRFGLSETMFTPAVLLWLVSLYYLLQWGQRDGWHRLLGSCAAALVAVQVRPEMYIMVAITLIITILCDSKLRQRIKLSWHNASSHTSRRRLLWTLGLGLLFVSLPVHNFLWRLFNGEQGSAHLVGFDPLLLGRLALNINLNPWEGGHVPFARAFSPLIVSIAAIVGMVTLLLRQRVKALVLVVPLAAMTVIWLPVQAAFMVSARLQQPLVVIWCLIAGYALGEAVEALKNRALPRLSMVAAVLFILALGLGLQNRDTITTHSWSPQHEFAFLQDALPQLPENAVIVIPQGDNVVNAGFPAAAAALQDRGIETVSIHDFKPSKRPAYFYLGLACWSFKSMETLQKQGPLRAECRDMLARSIDDPPQGLYTRIPADPYDFLQLPAGMLHLGFVPVQ